VCLGNVALGLTLADLTNESNSSDVNTAGSSWIIDGDHLTVLFRAGMMPPGSY